MKGLATRRSLKSMKMFAGFSIVLIIIVLIRRVGNETEDALKQNLSALEKLNEMYKDTKESEIEIKNLAKAKSKPSNDAKEFNRQRSKGSLKCPPYLEYAQQPHPPLTKTPLGLPYQRPPETCRTFTSPAVEKIIIELMKRLKDPDLARLTENALPNTLDTTILYHNVHDPDNLAAFVVTGDIHAEWLRDSTRQLSVYQPFLKYDSNLKNLIKGAVLTQAKYISVSPYCNAFHPPIGSGVSRGQTAIDKVYPRPNWKVVFECKWEVDSLGSFLTLTREYFENTGDLSVFNDLWFNAMSNLIIVLKRESSPTFDKEGHVLPFYYSFQRDTNVGTETLPLAGIGNPANFDVGLIRSAFRPSDDATIYQFFVPGNAYLEVELRKVAKILKDHKSEILKTDSVDAEKLALIFDKSEEFANDIRAAIFEHAVINHPKWGKVFAYEIDGYGGTNFMDDANIPSLLSLPDLGFIERTNEVYQNTRKMVLEKSGNPYYLKGRHFRGIGGPHIGIHNAWPMSLLLQIRTTDSDQEIMENLELIKNTTGGLGLIHESIHVDSPGGYVFTRIWFSWANSEFGKTILDLAQRKPHLIFKKEYMNKNFDINEILK